MDTGASDTSYSYRSLYHNCDSITTTLRYVVYDDTTAYSTTTEVIEITIRLRYDYDPTTTYRARLLPFGASKKTNMSIFRRSRVVVVSHSNPTQIVISITSIVVEYVVASLYRSRIVIESQL